jgi:SAM-dependent methyltransferase
MDAHAAAESVAKLSPPGGGRALKLDKDAFVGPGGKRFPIERGIVRMLGTVDAVQEAELKAQRLAITAYLSERMLIARYERRVVRTCVEMLGREPGLVCDLGCGVGTTGTLFPNLSMVGLDACFELLCEAHKGYQLRVEASATEIPFPNGTFHSILALNSLHHIPQPEKAIEECWRVLKPGGVLVTVDPLEIAVLEWIKRTMRRNQAIYGENHRAFSRADYQRLLRGDGRFEIEVFHGEGLLALIAAGGLDGIGLTERLPVPDFAFKAMTRLDDTIAMLPGMRDVGLNLYTRCRRIG